MAKRPYSVTILALSVLIIAVFFLTRIFQAVTNRTFITELDPTVSVTYLVLTGCVFGLAGLPTTWGLWTGKRWAGRAAQRFFIALAAYYWLDYSFFVISDVVRGRWPFALGTTLIGLAAVFRITTHPASKEFFRKTRAPRPENGDRNVE